MQKRILFVALIVLIVLGITIPAAAQEPAGNDATIGILPNEPAVIKDGKIQTIGADQLNLRFVPNSQSTLAVVSVLAKGTMVKPLADTGNGWNLVIVVGSDGTYSFSQLGYVDTAAAKFQPVDKPPVTKTSTVCDVETYTEVQGTVRFGARYVEYIPAEPCTVVFDGRLNPAERIGTQKIHDLFSVVEVSGAGRVESSALKEGLLVWAEGTYGRYPIGNTMDAPELGTSNAWTLVQGWHRDIRERLDDRRDSPMWVLRQWDLKGVTTLFNKGEYPDTAKAGSKGYTTCDDLTAPEELPTNGLFQGGDSKNIDHFVAAVGSQKCMSLFIGMRNDGLTKVPSVVLIQGLQEQFQYVKGHFLLLPIGWDGAAAADYVTQNIDSFGFAKGTTVQMVGLVDLPSTITLP